MRTLLVFVASILPSVLWAQTNVSGYAAKGDRPSIQYSEVEQGIYAGVEVGGLFLFSPKAKSGSGFSPGRSVGLSVGTDLGEFISIGALLLSAQTDTPSDFVGSGKESMKGDFSSFLVGGVLKANLLKKADSNGSKRFFITARVGGGYALLSPKGFYPANDGVVLVGMGIEYYTHLRHFSIGFQTDFVRGFSYLGSGIMVNPLLRYTF